MIKQIVKVDRLKGYVSYEPIDIEKYENIEGEKALSHSFVLDIMRKMMGKTLTLIDATITDPKQNKSMKDIIRGIYSEQIDFSSDIAFDRNEMDKLIGEIDEDNLPSTVSIEEVLGVEE